MSTDNSVYEIKPDLIVCPRQQADVRRLTKVLGGQSFAEVAITARGGGTGTNGQSLNRGVVVDFRRHMNRVIAINLEEQWVEVEPGIVVSELNDAIAYTGLFFAPTTSTANRCTIGGMIATDASGKGSRVYGKTSDNVLGLEAVLLDGLLLDSFADPIPEAELRLKEVAAACDSGRNALLERVPALSRRFTGYDLERARPNRQTLEWWRLLIGAEGTLGLVTKARLKLVPRLQENRLMVIGYSRFEEALAAAPLLLQQQPLAIEALDDWVQRLADDAGLLDNLPAALRGGAGSRPVYNFVEFAGNDAAIVDEAVQSTIKALSDMRGVRGYHVATSPSEIADLWSVRAASVGLLGKSRTHRKPIAFVEDCVVPPENLVGFVTEFSSMIRERGLSYGIYGHLDVGCLHVRPALDMGEFKDQAILKSLSDDVYRCVTRHGGIFWGEHGKGVRGEYLADFVGPTAYQSFRRIKAAFDPGNRFNPGKLVSNRGALYGVSSTPFRQALSPGAPDVNRAVACNGNGLCLNYAPSVAMCPSFKATKDLRHSPKGRAEALKAWAQATATKAPDLNLVEEATFAALDGCLGCKACAGACPVQVDIPTMKSRFLEAYFNTRQRSIADRAGIALERFYPQLNFARPFLRFGQLLRMDRAIAKITKLCDVPRFSARGLRSLPYPMVDPRTLSCSQPKKRVFIAPDAFTALFDVEAVRDVCDGLASLGFEPAILALPGGGKAAHAKGDRRTFLKQATRLAQTIEKVTLMDRPIVGVDPAFVLMLRDEYRDAGVLNHTKVLLVQEFILDNLQGLVLPPISKVQPDASLFLHCTEATRSSSARDQWQKVLDGLGLPGRVVSTGCCGMAGLFGHELEKLSISRDIFNLSWAKPLAAQKNAYATGFSCRCQVKRFGPRPIAHPMRLIANAFKGSDNSKPSRPFH
ncbi:FAD-binding and (Fe-S)-binding domain-containing protein [Agrobacterium sp. ICMP 6402]|uniref:FAD-binding and (Fe-S)-binding domain-containing protein n=1 Tax=Agrobacterium sp. ICMP 6402 TaxID=2292443 RepID=UPI001FEF7174|nr:FAD-binding and (Fe-S)-binding domain-containing protein [Agrobacterium sp. ICMP 6402]